MKTFLAGSCLVISLIAVVFLLTGTNTRPLAAEKTEVLLRNVGHRVLLAAGDSSSRVLPVKKVTDNVYLIRFESELSFTTDTLVRVIREALSSGINARILPDAYVVKVMECLGNQIIYGYQIAGKKEDTLVPCLGRQQPLGCYTITISFDEAPFLAGSTWQLASVAVTCLLLAGFIYLRGTPSAERQPAPPTLPIGQFAFDLKNGVLKHREDVIDLTAKESKILRLFAKEPNTVLERERLMKEVWEDEGVIVGRSLDMFVSKLRKKLQADPGVKITNVHGKGYKLEV